jgi:PiT family inorganic phosphate transporter
MDPLVLVALAVLAGIIFDLTNGWNDSANAIATVVSTRVLTPMRALLLSAGLNFVGALVSVKVARTMGAGVVDLAPRLESVVITLSAMLAAAGWVTWCTKLGLPVSCSHSLVGGLVGATVFVAGWDSVKTAGLVKILVALLASPLIGFVLAYLLVVLATWLAHDLEATPRQGRRVFGFFQLCSSSFMAFEHGKNDAQKVMGVIALALFAGGYLKDGQGRVLTNLDQLYIPLWVKVVCATAMAVGTAVGGWRVIRTLGSRLAKISTLEGFSAETAGGTVLEVAASLGVPVSTTHTITGGIIGVGAAKGARAVRWGIGAKIVWAWVFTLPVCFALGGTLSWFAARTSAAWMAAAVAAVTALTFAAARVRSARAAQEPYPAPKRSAVNA